MKTENITLSTNDKLNLISNISTMLGAGIPILETVDSLLEDTKGGTKKVLSALREDLIQGKHISASFARFPLIFDKVTINIIKASEEAGTLEITLKDLKTQIRRDIEFTDRVRSSLTYPFIIVIVFFGVMLLILTVVVPKIATVFLRLKTTLPLPTRILIFASNIIVNNTVFFIAGLVIIVVGSFFLYRQQKRLILNLFSSLPLITNLVKQIDLTRFSRSLYLLLTSGIAITSALELSQEVVLKPEIAKAIAHAREKVFAGEKLSKGFKDHKNVFTTTMIKMVEAGERTGTLDKSMQDVSEFLDYEVSNTLKSLTTILEPIMLVMVGVMVGGMMLAIIAPIYSLIGSVGGR